MVSQMLNEGLLEPNNSPLSSLVLVVKKKDGSWRFCKDYRALNAITIKDVYPILELLDELNGPIYFFQIRSQIRVSSSVVTPKR